MQFVAVMIVMISTSALILSRDWRITSLSLAWHYVGLALLFVGAMPSAIVLAELVLGVVATALVIPSSEARTKERFRWLDRATRKPVPGRPTDPESDRGSSGEAAKDDLQSPVFQALTLGLCAVAAISLSGTYPIAETINRDAGQLSVNYAGLNLAFFWLSTVGLLALSIVRRPMSIAAGLLFTLEAVQIAYLTRSTNVQPGAACGLVALQLMLVFIAMSSRGSPSAGANIASGHSANNEISRGEVEFGLGRPAQAKISAQPGIVLVLAGAALLAVLLDGNDVFLSSVVLTAVALLVALYFRLGNGETESAPNGMKFIALAVVGGACLQVAAVLAGEFQLGRDPLLGRIIVGFLALGLAMAVGALPFHWWLLAPIHSKPGNVSGQEAPRRTSSVVALPTEALAIGLLGAGGLAFFLQMVGNYPSLLSDERSSSLLMALGLGGFVVASLIAVSRRDLASLVAYTAAGNAGVALAGMGAGSYQGTVGAAILLGNQVLAMLLLALCLGKASHVKHWPRELKVETIGAFAREAPITTLGLAFSSLTLVGVPPFAGFLGRWLVYTEAARQNTLLASLVAIGSLLSLISFVPLARGLLAGIMGDEPFDPANDSRREPALYRIGMLSLALLPLGAGLYPSPILGATAQLIQALQR